ncbi:family 20 glycosylhydrolase [Lactiplantibacillus paraplantarum]|uniref:family 20 glycosylhydrolase n=1 Tax=Lactiplantibacillus paraplantarum TaxID=60520 RepID=UPI003B28646D
MKYRHYFTQLLIFISPLILLCFSQPRTATANSSTLNTSQGVMLDLGRHPLDETAIKAVISAAAEQHMQYVELHLADNEHLCFQSAYLGNTASATVLSATTLEQLVAYANQLNIELVPDVDLPSHAGAILRQLQQTHPDIYNTVKLDDETIDYTKPAAVSLATTLYGELDASFNNQSQHDLMLGADEVPGSASAYIELTTFINQVSRFQNQNGFNTSIWNDSLLKNELNRLDSNITINYWSQSGNNTDAAIIADRYANRASVPDILASGHPIVNCNSYATYYQIKNIGNVNDDDYFINYLNHTFRPNIFNEIDTNGHNQDWTIEDGVTTNGILVSLWGADSEHVTPTAIVNFIKRMTIPRSF